MTLQEALEKVVFKEEIIPKIPQKELTNRLDKVTTESNKIWT
jgi:hypothetical protein